MKNSFRISRVFVTLPLIGPSLYAVASEVPENRPNVIIIVSDDQGYADYSYMCPERVSTPNIDRLRSESMFFNRFYVEPASAPTRAAMLTGRSFVKTGVTSVHWGFDYVNQEETLISQVMKEAGYETALIGKWHSGKGPGYLPMDRGFDYVVSATMHTHLDSDMCWNDTPKLLAGCSPYYIQKEKKGWTVDRLADEAVKYIQEEHDKPFFMMLTYVAPHAPWVSDKRLVDKYIKKGQNIHFAALNALVEQMDASIGKVLSAVDNSDYKDNTIVIFFSDNGYVHNEPGYSLSADEIRLRNPFRLRGTKGSVYEGGILSPMCVRWPGIVIPGTNDRLSHVTDLLPTVAEIGGLKECHTANAIDGISFYKDLIGEESTGDGRVICSSFLKIPSLDKNSMNGKGQDMDNVRKNISYDTAVLYARNDRFKLVKEADMYSMYDMDNDRTETKDVSSLYPEERESLEKTMKNYFTSVVNEKHSYNKPLYYPGRYDNTVIYFNGAYRLRGSCHGVGQWSHCLTACQAGDSVEWRIKVDESADYDVWLEATVDSDVKIKLETEESCLDTIIKKGKLHNLGKIHIGNSAEKLLFSLCEDKEISELWNIILKK